MSRRSKRQRRPRPASRRPPTTRERLGAQLARLVGVARGVKGIAGFAAAVLGVVFVLWPNLKPEPPPREKRVVLGRAAVDRNVRFGQYLDRRRLTRGDYVRADLQRPGALVSFNYRIVGYRHERMPVHWQLIDATTSEQLAESVDLSIVPEVNDDDGAGQVWIAVPRGRARRLFVELELLNARAVPIGRTRTLTFRGPAPPPPAR